LTLRAARPVHDPITGESSFTYKATFQDATASCTQIREVHYVDAAGARERVDMARKARLGGVSLWALGYDSPATWTQIGSLATPDNGQAATTLAGATTTLPATATPASAAATPAGATPTSASTSASASASASASTVVATGASAASSGSSGPVATE
ncbi:MAG: hypothetical protein ABIR68_17050, partial [Ilumatobacteraceae bacterium]